MKNISTILMFLLVSFISMAQAPQKMSYQAVVRNAADQLIKNSKISLRISVLRGFIDGEVVYTETQQANSNQNGLVSIEIGTGDATLGTFAAIDWANGPYFIKNEIDLNGGQDYTLSTVNQMMSVPYALYAEKTAQPGPRGASAYEVWLSMGNSGSKEDFINELKGINDFMKGAIPPGFCKNVAKCLVNYNFVDTDDQTLSLQGTTLSIEDGNSVDLSALAGNNFSGNFGDLTNIPNGLSDGDDVDDADADATNELQMLSLSNDTLYLTNGGSVYIGGLGSGSTNWTLNGNNIYNANSGNVGINTNDPLVPLHIEGADEMLRLKSTNDNRTMSRWYVNSSPRMDFTSFASTGGQLTLYNGSGTYATRIGTGGNSYFRFGNLGIGTDNPTYKLQVMGDVKIGNPSTYGTNTASHDTKVLTNSGYYLYRNYLNGYDGGYWANQFFGTPGSFNIQTNCTHNIGLGGNALQNLTTGSNNLGLGWASLYSLTTGNMNVAVGTQFVMRNMTTGSRNIAMGSHSLYNNNGNSNLALGAHSGFYNTGSFNIFIGDNAGFNETGSYKLYIEPTNSSTPLIYGDFQNDSVRINGALSVSNAYTFPSTDGTSGQVLSTDGNGNLSWQSASGGSTVFTTNNNVTSNSNGDMQNDDFVFGAPTPDVGSTNFERMFFDKSLAAFRAGSSGTGSWNTGNVGQYSAAFGQHTRASHTWSFAAGRVCQATNIAAVAMGSYATASGNAAISLGLESDASAEGSVALGFYSTASGIRSVSIGDNSSSSAFSSIAVGTNVNAVSSYELVVGRYNTSYSPSTTGFNGWNLSDRLFTIGNGTGPGAESDAMIVRKSGDTEINGNVKTSGDVHLSTVASGIIMTSPNGACWRVTIDNSGNLVRTAITCP